jgi:hypothetical protein
MRLFLAQWSVRLQTFNCCLFIGLFKFDFDSTSYNTCLFSDLQFQPSGNECPGCGGGEDSKESTLRLRKQLNSIRRGKIIVQRWQNLKTALCYRQ